MNLQSTIVEAGRQAIEATVTRKSKGTPSRSRAGKSLKAKSRKARGRKASSKRRATRVKSKSNGEAPRRGRTPVHAQKVIEVLVTGNPRKSGTFGHKSFELYKKGMTVLEYFTAGGRSNDLAWDIKKGFVKLVKA